ncbi:MAG: hypothetical protein FWC41_07270 [Firmicutes bacterium]|nr:hypothetical protein [Bacillota bacterium]
MTKRIAFDSVSCYNGKYFKHESNECTLGISSVYAGSSPAYDSKSYKNGTNN